MLFLCLVFLFSWLMVVNFALFFLHVHWKVSLNFASSDSLIFLLIYWYVLYLKLGRNMHSIHSYQWLFTSLLYAVARSLLYCSRATLNYIWCLLVGQTFEIIFNVAFFMLYWGKLCVQILFVVDWDDDGFLGIFQIKLSKYHYIKYLIFIGDWLFI